LPKQAKYLNPTQWLSLIAERYAYSWVNALCMNASVATAIADIFRNNGISVGRNLAKILKIFEKINEAKGRGVI
jgi:hypothetical protein